MKRYRIHFSGLISLIVLCTACATKPYAFLQNGPERPSCRVGLKPEFNSVLYNTKVDVAGNHLSGLLFLKTMADGSIRIVFTNEMGFKMFDFEFFENEFRVIQCIKKLNKAAVIRALRRDLGMLVQAGYDYMPVRYLQSGSLLYLAFLDGSETIYLIADKECGKVERMEAGTKYKRKVIMNITGSGKGMPDSVHIAHQAFQFNIALKKVETQDAP